MDELAAEERSTQIAIKQGAVAINNGSEADKKGDDEVQMRAILKGTGSSEGDCTMLLDKRRQLGSS